MTAITETVPRENRRRWGIATRIALAFVLVVGLSSVACLAGLVVYERLSSELQRIVQRELPRLTTATRLAQVGAEINASVALLSSAETSAEFDDLYHGGLALFERLDQTISGTSEWRDNEALRQRQLSLANSLVTLEALARSRFTLLARLRTLVDELRWLQSDLIGEIEPLIDDARFNIAQDLEGAATPNSVLRETARSEALLTTLAQANLTVGLLSRFSEISSRSGVNDALAFLADSTDDLSRSIATLTAWSDSITVRQLASRVTELTDREKGVPAIKLEELDILEDIGATTIAAQNAVEALNAQIALEVAESKEVSREASQNAQAVLSFGRILLIAIVALSIAGAWAVAYFYVHRNLVAGIRRLAEEAVNASQGLPVTPGPLPRNDELGDLAAALQQLRQTRDELIQAGKLAALGQMAAGIAHELNQPLSALRSHSFNGSRQLERGNTAAVETTLEKITALIDRMSNQIAHIRRFARLPAEDLEQTSARQIMQEALALLAHRTEDDHVAVTIDCDSDDRYAVLAEPVRLEQVFVNLVANSLDALINVAVPRLHITLSRAPGLVVVRVHDNGGGIATAERSQIFDPFFTTKSPGAGLGLGLSISFNIARDFGGRLILEKSSQQGSTFLLELKEWSGG
ncbi:ATP-binding protein [Devosia naphthalenivorans]|uniref:ATP-binding protein n=1 Tax=Devosia naphthalenivorans TaxID=2082392 RepID=UPI0013B04E96|nr:ATP-binding protein [Devosia naphthalenivorans]